MFHQSIQPSTISLLSSVGSSPLQGLWTTSTDPKLPEDSFIVVLDDTSVDQRDTHKQVNLPNQCSGSKGKQLNCPVIQIQSPTIPSTYIVTPELSLKHSWVHLQVRNLQKEFAFEVGIVDSANRCGRIRWSTFQKVPRVYHNPRVAGRNHFTQMGPLLHLPLSFPSSTSCKLTEWCTIDANISASMKGFLSVQESDADSPSAARSALPVSALATLSYLKIYANCRLRRVWVSHGPQYNDSNQSDWPAEFQLYGG